MDIHIIYQTPKNIDVIDEDVKIEVLSISQVWNKLMIEERDHIKFKIPEIFDFISSEKYSKIISPNLLTKEK